MAEQFLKRAQIRSSSKKMGRETVTQRVRRQRIGQAEASPHRRHGAPNQIRIEGPAPRTAALLGDGVMVTQRFLVPLF